MSGYIGTQPVPQATQTRDSFTATSGQTSFATGGYTPNFLDVYLNGVKLASADYTATNGSDVVLASGAATGDILEVVAFTTFTPADLPAGTPSIDDNGNATALTIDSSENVLIGQTTASSGTVGTSLRPDGRNFYCADGNYSAHFNRNSSDGAIAHFAKDDTIVGSIGVSASNNLAVGSTSGSHAGITFGTNTVAPMNVSNFTNADDSYDLGNTSSRWQDLYLSGGIHLGGTGSANKLDDYEEGTWTPLAKGTSTNPTVAPTLIGRYTKIGNQVNIYIKFDAVSFAGASGGVYFDGLPFSATGTTVHGIGSVMQYNVCTFNDSPCLYVSGSAVYIYHNVSGSSWDNSAHTGSSQVYMNACATYTTNS
jgi:hypothetical protein